jgi:HTH-type transcriptional regulator / antitoxin MqsA
MNMICPVCGGAELLHDTRDIPFVYKHHSTLLLAVEADFCSACHESITDNAMTERVMADMHTFSTAVDAALAESGFIASVRRKLGLDQQQAATVFGGSASAFSRYENGKTKPPVALVKLFKILERHPHLLSEINLA